jgi:hypothetical protein
VADEPYSEYLAHGFDFILPREATLDHALTTL